MRKCKWIISIVIFFFFITSFSQSPDLYNSFSIPSELRKNANAVVRYDNQLIQINDYDDMYVTKKRVVTVLNEYGNKHINAVEFYDNNTRIKKIEVFIFDASGKEIKKVKQKDFTDQSAVSGGTLYSDNRVKFLNYTPLKYPYTVEFYSEVQLRSTAFIPKWVPVDGYYLAVESSEYKIDNLSNIYIKTKAENFEGYNIKYLTELHLKADNLKGIKYEAYNHGISNIVPKYKSALTRFNMEGVEGVNNNWKDFGKWMYDKLITGTDNIPQRAIDEVKALTKDVNDNIEKAKIVYEYMQDKTRYISVQVGIGGWKPMNAMDVDKLGYSDCKGLTNYTKALLEAIDIPSYYTVVWGDSDIKDIDSEFSVTEGNHVILCLPNDNENIFLECTSQTSPFGFTAGFTDDRNVLIVKPEGGEIVRTKIYKAEDSQQITVAEVNFSDKGSFKANVEIKTTGFQYALHEDVLRLLPREQKLNYKEYWNNLNNLEILDHNFENNKDSVELKETVNLEVVNYASKTGNRLIVMPNIFNRVVNLPPRYDNRKLDFKIQRAYKDIDEYVINLPENIVIEAMEEGAKIESKFGSYEYKLEKLNENKLKYSRSHIMNKDDYNKEDYEAFRDFKKEIVKLDKSKIVLKINN